MSLIKILLNEVTYNFHTGKVTLDDEAL